MIYILQNSVPIALATLAGLAIGAIWLRLAETAPLRWQVVALAALAEFWLAAILAGALILAPDEAGAWTMALGSAFIIWLGFVLPALAVTLAALGRRTGTILAASGHWLVVMLVQAAILQAAGLVAPAAT
ncbi:hypothetical protein [Alteraurantiacibacter palmitatis]|uniref:DUF1761 domain-containing protein n=1 Tax=Alteraurantiacibacter palmitatis TaxID=2054628 RepID=A0ABV7E5I2_9SPHN